MMVEVYVGEIHSTDFNYDKGNWQANLPARISPFFPNSHKLFYQIVKDIGSKKLEGKQTDWGTWVAILSSVELIEWLTNIPFEQHEVDELSAFIESLNLNQQIALVACEIG